MLKRFISYYKPHKKLFIYVMLVDLGICIINMLYPIINRTMLNDFIPNRKFDLVVIFGISLFVIYFIKAAFKYIFDYYGHKLGTYIQADMRKELFSKLEKLPFKYFDDNETGKIMSSVINDLQEISELAHHGPENICMAVVMLLFSFFYLSSISLPLTLIIFSCMPILFFITFKLRIKHIKATREARKSLAEINANVNSSISGIRVTRAFNNENIELKKFNQGNNKFINAKLSQFKMMSIFHAATTYVTDLFNVVCLIAGGIFLYKGSITFGDYSAFIISIGRFVTPIQSLVNFAEVFQEGTAGFERFVELIDEPIETDKKGAKDYKKLKGDIEFNNVCFSYTKDAKEILNDVSFNVNKGKTIALVGPSGGGKTTICHLLLKFYQIDSGEIKINNINIDDIKMESLRRHIGIVQQDVFLFNGTFYDNILYGRLDASEKEVIAASKKANIYDYIMSLPEGFNTQIGERGVKLSGGQKQRLSIARVFLKNPDILILDEATSSLDNTTEIMIQESLNNLKKGRTTIIVAHRLSTIQNADNILVISKGKIIEEGNHNELIKKKKGFYSKLYKAQFKDSNDSKTLEFID